MPFASASRLLSNISRARGQEAYASATLQAGMAPCMPMADRSSPSYTSRTAARAAACCASRPLSAVCRLGYAAKSIKPLLRRLCRAAGCQISAYKQVATKKPAFHPMKGGLANARSGNQPTLHSNTVMLRGGARNSLAPAGMLSTSSASSVESASFQCTGSSEEGRVKVTPSW